MGDRLTEELSAIAVEQGATGFGVAGVEPFERERLAIRSRKDSGLAGPLRFTYDDPDVATDVSGSFPWARRLVVVAWSYLGSTATSGAHGAVVGRFAISDQYQRIRQITSELASRLHRHGHRAEVLIDDNRLVDRAAAVRAGVGWSGKSTMTLVPGVGPWALLGSVVTDAPLTISEPMARSCGTCTACIPACPTNALGEWGLDARRCLSTWLQTPGSIPHWIRPLLGRRIYGCDDCLTACPPGRPALAAAGERTGTMPFGELLALGDDTLLERFSWCYVPRRDGRYLRRNLLVAAGNSGEPEATELLEGHMAHPSSMIRSHAAWALGRSLGVGSVPTLRAALDSETAPETRDELSLAMLMVERRSTHHEVLSADEWARGHRAVRALALTVDHGLGQDADRMKLLVIGDVPRAERWDGPALQVSYATAAGRLARAPSPAEVIRVFDPGHILGPIASEIRRKARLQV